MTPALPELVVFDLAGTTVDDRGQVPAAFAAALRAHGVAATAADVEAIRGASKREAFAHLLARDGGNEGLAVRVDAAYATFQQELRERFARAGVGAVPGATGTFAWLRGRGVRLALNTGFDRDITRLLLAALGWLDGVADAIVCVDDVAAGRPAPDLILAAMARTGVADPRRVANVGDTTLDLEAAARAGVGWSFGVLSGAHRRERLERSPHTRLLGSVADLPAVWSAAG